MQPNSGQPPRRRRFARAGKRVVNFRHLRAQPADVDRHVAPEQSALAEIEQHRQHLLRFAQGKHRHQHRAAARKRLAQRARKPLLLRPPREARRDRVIAARGLDDEHVERLRDFIRKPRGAHDGLVVEIHVAGVKNAPPAVADQHAC